jgi:hypothetical protein
MTDFLPPENRGCHRCGFTKKCFDLVVTEKVCHRWKMLQGIHPQTGADMQVWDCIDDHCFLLLMNLGKETREVGGAVESFRNETVGRADATLVLSAQQAQHLAALNQRMRDIAEGGPRYQEIETAPEVKTIEAKR